MASVKIKANCYHCDKEFAKTYLQCFSEDENNKNNKNEYEEYINTHS